MGCGEEDLLVLEAVIWEKLTVVQSHYRRRPEMVQRLNLLQECFIAHLTTTEQLDCEMIEQIKKEKKGSKNAGVIVMEDF